VLVTATFDHAALVAELDRQRVALDVSWRQIALDAGLEPSTLQRIVAGSIPDLPRFAALVDWLAVPADRFIQRSRAALEVDVSTGQRVEIKVSRDRPLTDEQLRSLTLVLTTVVKAMGT
jgi:hypothetical protein